jgi:molybdopterin-synthase adenylyltransferase
MSEGRYSRQEALFGEAGQQRLTATRVAIVGVGGLGAHVAQQLAYAGVSDFLLADPDTVSVSNLNRLIGATPSDAAWRLPKVRVTARMIRAIQPRARVRAVQSGGVLAERDVLFSCVDDDRVRLDLTSACAAARIPFFDLASDTGEGWYGGRVLFSGSGERCPWCMDLLDRDGLREESDAQRAERDAIYGVARGALQGTGPAVVSINGVVASLAVSEFLKWRTKLAAPVGLVTYRAEHGSVRVSADRPRSDCYYCTAWQRAAA